jgi:uncharacterized membrane protein YhaH (DUF805 family)
MSTVQKLLGFQGRLRRRDWWLFAILLVVIGWALTSGGMAMLGASLTPFLMGAKAAAFDVNGWMAKRLMAQALVSLILLWPSLAIGVKRLHDRNRTGWWMGLIYLLTWLQLFMSYAKTHTAGTLLGLANLGPAGALLALAVVIVGIWLLVELGLLDGTKGPNRFGPSPKGIE